MYAKLSNKTKAIMKNIIEKQQQQKGQSTTNK